MEWQETLSHADPLSRVFATAFILVGVPCLIYLLSLQKDARLTIASVGFIGTALGVVLARDFLWFLVFWELTVLVACYLIVQGWLSQPLRHGGQTDPVDRSFRREHGTVPFACAKSSGFIVAYRYFVIQIVAGASLFFAVATQYAATGSFAMDSVTTQAMPFFLVAFLIKTAVIPFHVWVPLTYPCVPPAIAVILSAYSTKIGVYAFARLLPGIPWIAYAGAFMALFGVVMALRQKTARRLLSYHLISQVGYMIAGIGLGTELGIGAGALHMMNNVVYKSLLFMVAGAVLFRTGTDVLARVRGAGRSMPLTFVAGLVAAAAISGMPPLNGYVSKTLLKTATEGHTFLQSALFLAGIGTVLSFTKFIWYLFLQKEPSDAPTSVRVKEVPFGACLAMGILAVLCVAQGIDYPRFFALAHNSASESVYSAGSVLIGVAAVLAGVALFVLNQAVARSFAGQTAARPTGARAASIRGKSRRRTSSGSASREEAPPWDIDLGYAWLLHRVVRVSQYVARRATDETQAYILVITAVLVALVAYLAWSA
ncbi:MAG: proton-conducting transporter membrane subunit [Thermoguttaceae bacterium]|jgi:multicomponent Na+:H+ antiporter subunit D|nr:proton-conducting transporter membrane subunit [Thermoguttaceae bacterium]